ncbi:hypothetical protein [Ectobacillus ponti]|uniref:Uncharacterized protein n=1 Tax=Ectobacillus ponti TaxID=2961894 RepID=A0AA41XCZ8_9BACI|nr:hypothetical protein [Ectobacillus ponti]MCP8970598.1 hypothetical protein [Ectobacillus ponti]
MEMQGEEKTRGKKSEKGLNIIITLVILAVLAAFGWLFYLFTFAPK